MKFFAGPDLTAQMRMLASSAEPKKIAIAYWGQGAAKRLGLDFRGKQIEVICCLTGGKSDPDEIGKFGDRAKQNDRLHAKVIWTPRAAIVGSANASSNGLPEEEPISLGLEEAGILVTERGTLDEIKQWFDAQFLKARDISPTDLANARRDRILGKRYELIDLPPARMKDIVVLVWTTEMDDDEEEHVAGKIAGRAELHTTNCDHYFDTVRNAKQYPLGCHALVFQTSLDGRRRPVPTHIARFADEIVNGGLYKRRQMSVVPSWITGKVRGTARFPGVPTVSVGRRSIEFIRERIANRRCKLANHLPGTNGEGFISWVPLADLMLEK